jgi:hypothetical protein
MVHARHGLRFATAVAVGALALTGCGPSSTGSTERSASSGPSQVTASPSARANTPDGRACAGIQAVMGHLATDTQRWSPTLHPFDKTVATRIRLRAKELDVQAPQAESAHVKEATHATSDAFVAIADAMTHRRSAGVRRYVQNSRVAYRDLKQVCGLH